MAQHPSTREFENRARRRLAFALDAPDLHSARHWAERVGSSVGYLKIGLELFVAAGPAALQIAAQHDVDVFLDLKLHDIPATVGGAVGAVCQLGVQLLTLHASGGPAMIEAARERVDREGSALKLIAVSVLTSLSGSDLVATGVHASPEEQTQRLARLALGAGAHGIVCSPQEVASLRREFGRDVLLVTPGVRPAGAALGDQKRVASPGDAIRSGADLLVVGRPIRDAADPGAAAQAICAEIEAALG